MYKNLLVTSGILLVGLFPEVAQATIYQFDVEIEIDGATVSGNNGVNLGLEFSYFANGFGTYDSESGKLSINSSGLSCQGGAGNSCGATYAYGTHGPWSTAQTGYLALGSAQDSTLALEFNNLIEKPDDASLVGLTYGAQEYIGAFTVPVENSPAWVPPVASVGIMESIEYGYAAKVLQSDDRPGVLELNGWFLFTEGIFGSTAAHVESQVGEALFNGSIRLIPANVPETEVPEPFTAALLGAGLLGGAFSKRKSS